MTDQLLVTKLNTPPLRPSLVPRPRLAERLERGLTERRSLTLISAPAGYGKTTLACTWLADRMNSGTGPPAVTWLALDEGDNDPALFFAYLVAALRKFDAGIGQMTLDLATSPHLPPAQTLMTPLINEIALSSEMVILVLDDLHAVCTPSIFDSLDFLAQHGPPNLHLVLITREDPPLSLPTLRARGQMTELRTQDLRFTDEEAQVFFKATMGLELEPAVANGLEARTEGWVAGLQLAALSVQGCPTEDLHEFLAAFNGSDRYVMDYLIEQVARRLPQEIHSFLCATAVLDRMNASLCDAMTGRTDGKAMLQRLDQANLFLVRLDAQGRWFRFHHLFAELVRLELDDPSQQALHRRAAKWFEENALLPEAVHHALAGQDYDEAARLIRLAASVLLPAGEFRTLLGWIDRLAHEVLPADAELCVHAAAASLFTGHARGAAAYLGRLESREAGATIEPRVRGRLLALRAWLAVLSTDIATARRCAQQALDLMGNDEAFYRMAALLPLGHAQNAEGQTRAAEQTYRAIVAIGREAGHTLARLGGLLSLAFNLIEQGHLGESVDLCESILRECVDRRGATLPVASIMYLPLATALYHRNRLGEARESAAKGLEASAKLLSEDIMGGDGEMVLAFSRYALGEKEAAFATLHETRIASEQFGYQHVARAFAALEADLHLREGNIGPARSWVESRWDALAEPPTAERGVEFRVYVRFLLAEGRFQDARTLLHVLVRQAREGGREARAAMMLIWQAIVEHNLHNTEAAVACLSQAVRFAAPEGFQRMFLDTGQPALGALLPKVRAVAPDFVDGLLNALSRDIQASCHVVGGAEPCGAAGRSSPAPALVEHLSARELEVLRLLAEGLSYRQVAGRLIVAMGTVQAHCGNIYGKLGVNNRTQALARARELRLL